MITVACFLWKGDRWDDKELSQEYVNRLYRGIKRNTSLDFKFVCFTNGNCEFDTGIEILPLKSPSWKGCLPKLYAYSKDNGLKGRVFVFDLDTVIVGDLDEYFAYDGTFATRAAFKKSDVSGGDMLSFEAGTMNWFWDKFNLKPGYFEKISGGSERIIYRKLLPQITEFFQDIFPDVIYSYKQHIKYLKLLPEKSSIISCHGKPRPHEIDEEWVKDNWI